MRFFALITLLALLLIQSQTAHADFGCNKAKYSTAKVGYCAIQSSQNTSQGPLYLVKAATVVNQSARTFTCQYVNINGQAPTNQWCCSKPPTIYSDRRATNPVYKYTAGEALAYCYAA